MVAIICFVLIESGNILRLSLSSVNLTFRGTMVGRAGIGYKAKKSDVLISELSDFSFLKITKITCKKKSFLLLNEDF